VSCLAGKNTAPGSCMVELDGRVYEIHVTPLPPRPEHPAEGVYVSRDVTERVAAAERQAHQERMYVTGEIAAVVAHEMNNPIAAIVMFSQMLLESLGEDSRLREHANVILRNADACRRTVSSLLEMSAFPAPEVTAFDAADLLADVGDFLRPLVERTDHRLVVAAPDTAIHVCADEIQIRQVLINLVMNAVQTGEGESGSVTVRAASEGADVVIEVEDEGPGVPADICERIFEPFFSTKPPGIGTGLGLPTSRRIVESHGGTLTLAASGAGRTVFEVRLPRDGAIASSLSQPRNPLAGSHAARGRSARTDDR